MGEDHIQNFRATWKSHKMPTIPSRSLPPHTHTSADSGWRETSHTYKPHTDVSHSRAGRKPPPRDAWKQHRRQQVRAGRVRGCEGRSPEGRAAYQVVHDAHAVRVYGEGLLVQLLGLFKAALHLSQPASHVEHRVRGGEEARSLLDAEARLLELSLLHEQISCDNRGAGCEWGKSQAEAPALRPDPGRRPSQHRVALPGRVTVGTVSHRAGYVTQTALVNATETLGEVLSLPHVRNRNSSGME